MGGAVSAPPFVPQPTAHGSLKMGARPGGSLRRVTPIHAEEEDTLAEWEASGRAAPR